MHRAISRHLTYANVVSTLCLALLVGGGTALALSVTGSQIVNGTVTGRDVRNGSLTGSDVKSGSVGLSRLAASTRTSLSDTSPWEVIPSGQTITGAFQWDFAAPATVTHDMRFHVPFGALAPVALADTTVDFAPDLFAATAESDATCTGSLGAPSAPAGRVCLYLGGTSADAVSAAGMAPQNLPRTGFDIRWNETGPGSEDVFLSGSWAYTAP